MWMTTLERVAVSADVSFCRTYPAVVTRKIGTMTVSSVSANEPKLAEPATLPYATRPELPRLLERMIDFTC